MQKFLFIMFMILFSEICFTAQAEDHSALDAMELKYHGTSLTNVITGFGCVCALKIALGQSNLNKMSVAIQGFGSVGSSAALFSAKNGVRTTGNEPLVTTGNGAVSLLHFKFAAL